MQRLAAHPIAQRFAPLQPSDIGGDVDDAAGADPLRAASERLSLRRAHRQFLGCEVEPMYPLGALFLGCGLNVTVLSLNGKLNVGVISCPDLVPDLWRLVDDFNVALEELLECTVPARR